MPAILNGLCRTLYAITWIINLLVFTGISRLISFLFCLPQSVRQGCASVCSQTAFRVSFFFCPWVWCTCDDKSAEAWSTVHAKMKEVDAQAAMGEPYKPLMILGNHTSFLDTPLGMVFVPMRTLYRCKLYASAGLLKLPLICSMCRLSGHLMVPFSSDQGGKFTLDKDKLAEVEQQAEEHVRGGGYICMFPEGTINSEPTTLMPFRHGGMKNALEWDARVMFAVGHGSQHTWPKDAMIGGMPGRVRCSFRCVAPDGVKAYIAELRDRTDLPAEDKKLEDHELLGKYLRLDMQGIYNELVKVAAGAPSAGDADANDAGGAPLIATAP